MTDTDAPETMLHAYNKSLDWLQWGDEFDDESAACTLIYMDWQRERIKKLERVIEAARKFRDEMTCYSTGISTLSESQMTVLDNGLIEALADLDEGEK